MLIFRVVEVLAQLFPESSGPLANFAGDLFDILGFYFPIHFTHVRSLNYTVSLLFTCVFFLLLNLGNMYLTMLVASRFNEDIFNRFPWKALILVMN